MESYTDLRLSDQPITSDFIKNVYNGFIGNEKEHHPTLNALGHRCDELEDVLGKSLDFKKYFIVLGDNAGLHMHQPVEETWPYLLAKETNHTYYNLCVIDGGLEAVRFNLLSWLAKRHPPKYIFIACEWANRFFGVNYEDDTHDIVKASNLGDDAGYFLGRQRMFSMLVDQIDIPIYQIMRPTDVPVLISSNVKNIIVDHADDQTVVETLTGHFRDVQRARSV